MIFKFEDYVIDQADISSGELVYSHEPSSMDVHVHVYLGTVMAVHVDDLIMTESQFQRIFPGAADIINNALEAEAQERQDGEGN